MTEAKATYWELLCPECLQRYAMYTVPDDPLTREECRAYLGGKRAEFQCPDCPFVGVVADTLLMELVPQ